MGGRGRTSNRTRRSPAGFARGSPYNHLSAHRPPRGRTCAMKEPAGSSKRASGRARGARHGSQGLEDVATVHAHQARGAAPDRRRFRLASDRLTPDGSARVTRRPVRIARPANISKHGVVGWDLPPLRSWLATLCVALAVTFAVSSAVGIVDHVQHDMQLQHEHGLQLTASHDDHHPPAHAGDHEPADDDDGADDPSTGPGHHHADAPSVALAATPQASPSAILGSAALQMVPPQPAGGVPPGGPERPPRAFAKLA